MFCERIYQAIDTIGTLTFKKNKVKVYLNSDISFFLTELKNKELPKNLFERIWTQDLSEYHLVGFEIKKTDFTCIKDQTIINPLFIAAIKKATLLCFTSLASNWVDCTRRNKYFQLDESNEKKVIQKSCKEMHTHSRVLENIIHLKGFEKTIQMHAVEKDIFLIGLWQHLKEFSTALRAESMECLSPPLPLSLLTVRVICSNRIDYRALPQELIEKVEEEAKFCLYL